MKQKTFPLIGKYSIGWTIVFALVILFIFGLVTGLSDSVRRLSPDWLFPFGVMAMLFGWVFSKASKKQELYSFSAIFLGSIIIIIVQSGVYQNFSRAYFETHRNLLGCSYPCYQLPNPVRIYYYFYAALSDLSIYFTEIFHWLQTIIQQQAIVNQLAINLTWGSFVWVSSFLMGWLLRRKFHAFIAALPAFVLLSAVLGYTRQRTSGLTITLTALLALMVLIEHLKRENNWENQQIDYSEELRFEIITTTVPIVIIIMVIAGFLPRISIENIRSMLFNRQPRVDTDRRLDLPESFGLEQTPFEPSTRVSQPGMPLSHLIGSGVELEETLVMEVDIGEEFLPPQVDPQRQPPKYYWFGSAYQIYMGSGWIIDEIRTESILANQELLSDPLPFYVSSVHQFTKSDTAPRTLYYAGILNTVDQNITVAWHEATDDYFTAQLDALAYRVNTYLYNFSEEELRQTDQQPPDFILEYYLQLPHDLPDRVEQLALDISKQASTPYDQAKAIETFLRQYEYSLDLPEPPQDRDLVDYFLFELQRGYCDYFASAMVVLARINGLPARLAVGYATGSYDFSKQVFAVTEANAHAWPEIYIEPFGWIPFEPTASLTVHNWTTEDETTPIELPFFPSQEQITRPEPTWLEILSGATFLFLILLTGLLVYILYRRRNNPPSTTEQIEAIYQRMRVYLSRVFFTLQKEHTPREVCHLYTQHLSEISSHGFSQKTSSLVSGNITIIVNLYEKGVYTTQNLAPEQIRTAQRLLFSALFQAWLLKTALFFRKS